MKIAILGATSQIAKDLIVSLLTNTENKLHLFARRPDDARNWLNNIGLSDLCLIDDFSAFGIQDFDVIINFVGVGNPEKTSAMGASIFDVTLKYDELALNYLREHPACRYIFLSSGAAYGSNFGEPANVKTNAAVAINNLQPQNWYGVAKLHAESRHRSLADFSIVDIRFFNYFSQTQDIEARFLISDILRAIRDNSLLKVSSDNNFRDYLHPSDFYQLVCKILAAPKINIVLDCYSKAPIEKFNLLTMMHEKFGLHYEISESNTILNATGNKPYYYSMNKLAGDFGYLPTLTSAECIIKETNAILHK
jgi:nucleoside-diphosphate-sugar epimerase